MIYKSYLVEGNIKILQNNINLFYGENLGLKNDLKFIIKKNYKEFKIIRFFEDELLKNNNLLLQEISNGSLFDEKKIIFIEQVSDKITNLIEGLEIKSDDEKIFLFSDILEKRSKLRNFFEKSKKHGVSACYPDNEISIKSIIQKKLKEFQGLSATNINLILDNSNLDRVKLNNEIDKIHLFFSNKVLITEKLEKLLNTKNNQDFNILKDEALLGNKSKTNKLLSDTTLEEDKNIFYLNTINQRLGRLFQVSKSKEKSIEKAIEDLKPPIFWKDKKNFLEQAKKWDQSKIRSLLRKTYEIEVKIKSNNQINKNFIIKNLIVDICESANAS